MTIELFVAGVMLLGLVIYALTGGADFGGGVWDLLARGPRADAQRTAIERAIAPVWEANHVWLIFIVTVMFTAFPPAFARLGIELHVPVTFLLIGIVMRGSAFVFRQYGGGERSHHWGHVFAISSTVAPVFLGIVLGAMTTGGDWWQPFPLAVGVLTLACFAFLAAVYLTVEVPDEELREDFRERALAASASVIAVSVVAALLAHRDALAFAHDLLGSWWSPVLIVTATIAMGLAIVFVHQRAFRLARVAAIITIASLIVGWGAAHAPSLVAPLTLAEAAAPPATFRALIPIIVVGGLVLVPSLWWLLRVFKTTRTMP